MELKFRVKKSERGERLDAFLYKKMGTWSHRQIKSAIDKKKTIVNGKNVFVSGWNLKPGDVVLFYPEKSDQAATSEPGRYSYVSVIFEDDDILAVNKPPFVDYDSYVPQVNAYLKRRYGPKYYPYLGQIHRLDKETSGLLVFTKKKSANVLAHQFRDRRVLKFYLAVVMGRVEKNHGVIRERLEKGKFEGGKKAKIAEDGGGKESFTEYWVEERYETATLLRLRIGTGRTHQIRVHMASMGHPVVGDKLYGEKTIDHRPKTIDPKTNKSSIFNHQSSIKRQALHAHEIEFDHPLSGRRMNLKAPLPKDISALIDAFRSEV